MLLVFEEAFIALGSLLGNSSITAGAGTSQSFGSFLKSIGSAIGNIFTNPQVGAWKGSARFIEKVIPQILTLKSTTYQQEFVEIKELLKEYELVLDSLSKTETDKLKQTLKKTEDAIKVFQKDLLGINEVKNFYLDDIKDWNGKTYNMVGIHTKDGKSFIEGDSQGDIPNWYKWISNSLQDIDLIGWEIELVKPLNFFSHGANASCGIWTGVIEQNGFDKIFGAFKVLMKTPSEIMNHLKAMIDLNIAILNSTKVSIPTNKTREKNWNGELTLEQELTLKDFLIRTGRLSLSKTMTKNVEEEGEDNKKYKKRKKRKTKNKKKKNKPKKKIIKIETNTKSSKWIKSISFQFYTKQNKDSDSIGKLIFHLKSGTQIVKHRVKRGTFSVIVVWSRGFNLGVGYRYWSQFNKHNIVNKNVLSYGLARINSSDRQLAIPLELKENSVKYK